MTEHLPSGWGTASLEEVAEVILGQSPPGSSYNNTGHGIPFFQGKAEFGVLYPTITKWTTAPKKLARRGDILLSVRAPVGPTNIASVDCSIGRGLHAIRPYRGVNRDFLLWAIRASVHRLQQTSTGTTFNAVNGKQVKNHNVPIAPYSEQIRIVGRIEEIFSRLDSIESTLVSLLYKEVVRASLGKLYALRRSVLTEAFSGRLVSQDPSDEPASALLDRIAKSHPTARARQKATA